MVNELRRIGAHDEFGHAVRAWHIVPPHGVAIFFVDIVGKVDVDAIGVAQTHVKVLRIEKLFK